MSASPGRPKTREVPPGEKPGPWAGAACQDRAERDGAPMSTWVLLRGLTRETGHWGGFTQQLAQGLAPRRIVCLDLPGNGTLHRLRSPIRVHDMVEHCRTQLKERGVGGPIALLAMSLGAMVAVAWAEAHPGELCGCVLINTSLKPFSPFHHRLRPSSYPALLAVLACRDASARESAIQRLTSTRRDAAVLAQWIGLHRLHPVSPLNALRQLLAAARFVAPLRSPEVPMLLLDSRRDMLVNPRCSAALARRWGLPLEQHPTAGHDLPLDDGPWVVEQIASWMRRR